MMKTIIFTVQGEEYDIRGFEVALRILMDHYDLSEPDEGEKL